MSTKVKSNLLYIASDDSSEEQSHKAAPNKPKQQQNIPATKFNLVGSHRLNNNTISQGFFIPHRQENDYQYENPERGPEGMIKANTVKLNPRSPKKLMPASTNCQNIREVCKNDEPVQQMDTEPEKQTKKTNKTDRAKTLMFQLDSQQSDNEIQSKQQCTNNKVVQELTQISGFQIHNEKCLTTEDDKQSEESKIVQITPASIEQKIDKKQFLISEIPRGHVLECKVTKKNEISNLMFSQFDMTFRNYLTHVASCKKIIANLSANYRISLDDQDFNYTRNKIIGKVRSCEGKQIYNVYDNGFKPDNSNSNVSQARQILATVRIKTRKGPRSLEVYILKQGVKYSSLLGFKMKKQLNLETLYSIEQNRNSITLLKTRQPEWVEAKKQYFLNFRGRIKQASIRNFILEDPKTSEQVLLFGKAYNNIYNIDISYPLTPMLGFAIAIPQLDRDD